MNAAGFGTLRIAHAFVKPPRPAVVLNWMLRRWSLCSARLQASTVDSSTCPPEGGRYNTSLLRQVAMHYFGCVSLPVQRLTHRFRKHYRTVPAARAAKSNRQIAFTLPDIMRDQIHQQAVD